MPRRKLPARIRPSGELAKAARQMAQPWAQAEVSRRPTTAMNNRTQLMCFSWSLSMCCASNHDDVRRIVASGLAEGEEEQNDRKHKRREREHDQVHSFEFKMHED